MERAKVKAMLRLIANTVAASAQRAGMVSGSDRSQSSEPHFGQGIESRTGLTGQPGENVTKIKLPSARREEAGGREAGDGDVSGELMGESPPSEPATHAGARPQCADRFFAENCKPLSPTNVRITNIR